MRKRHLSPEKETFLRNQSATNRTRIVEIREIRRESPTVKTFTFQDKLCSTAHPGQFIMTWIPGIDEIPMSLSMIGTNGMVSISVADVGEATHALHQKKRGDVLGIRGPLGNGFRLTPGRVLIVAGGTGLMPLAPLTEKLIPISSKITLMVGVETKTTLIFLDRLTRMLSQVNAELIVSTEDGSYGLNGLITDHVENELAKTAFDMVYACGPEQMLQKIFLLVKRYATPLQVSLERLIRCAMGLCGSCMIGSQRVCMEGPVFTSDQLKRVETELGRFKRDRSGTRISFS